MGQKWGSSLNISPTNFRSNEWDLQTSIQGNSYLGSRQTFNHIHTHQKIDRYLIKIKSVSQLHHNWDIYLWRKNKHYINKSYFYIVDEINDICSLKNNEASIFLEHVSWRLSQIKDIPFPQNIYCVKSMLRGFKTLFNSFGQFKIHQEQVCIDINGNISVWFHSNLSSCYKQLRDDHKNSLKNRLMVWDQKIKTEKQQQMVNQIIEMVYKNTDVQTEPKPSLKQYYHSFKLSSSTTFNNTLKMVQQYIEMIKLNMKLDSQSQNLVIPKNLQSIVILNKIKKMQKYYKTKNQQIKGYIGYKTDRINQESKIKNFELQMQLRRPTTYCQSLPNRYKINQFPQNNKNMMKNASSKNLDRYNQQNMQELPLGTTPKYCYADFKSNKYQTQRVKTPKLHNESIKIQAIQTQRVSNYKNQFPDTKRTHPSVNIMYHSPRTYGSTNINNKLIRNYNSLGKMCQYQCYTPKNELLYSESKIIVQKKTANYQNFVIKQKNSQLSSDCQLKNRFDKFLPKITHKSKTKLCNNYYFTSNGSKFLLDKEISQDLQKYDL